MLLQFSSASARIAFIIRICQLQKSNFYLACLLLRAMNCKHILSECKFWCPKSWPVLHGKWHHVLMHKPSQNTPGLAATLPASAKQLLPSPFTRIYVKSGNCRDGHLEGRPLLGAVRHALLR